jgi:hypothetical protein
VLGGNDSFYAQLCYSLLNLFLLKLGVGFVLSCFSKKFMINDIPVQQCLFI